MRHLIAIVTVLGLYGRAHAETDDPAPQPADDRTAIAVKKALEEDRAARRANEDADRTAKQQREEAEAAYQKQAIVFRDFMVATVGDGGITSINAGTIAYRNGRKLSTSEFYEAVERPDLAATYRRRRTIGRTLSWTGIGVGLAASAWGLYAVSKPTSCSVTPDLSACLDRESADDKRVLVQSSVVMGAGLVALVVGLVVTAKSHPTSMNENHDMADAHNAKLRKRHKLTARVAPYTTPDGGGLSMVGQF